MASMCVALRINSIASSSRKLRFLMACRWRSAFFIFLKMFTCCFASTYGVCMSAIKSWFFSFSFRPWRAYAKSSSAAGCTKPVFTKTCGYPRSILHPFRYLKTDFLYWPLKPFHATISLVLSIRWPQKMKQPHPKNVSFSKNYPKLWKMVPI